MGLLGNLFSGGKVDVEGSLSLLNRPAETFFVLTVHFFPCAPRSAPLATGMPDPVLLSKAMQATHEGPSAGRVGDAGEHFTARLTAGHYQVCVTALPMALETSPETGQARFIADPNNRFAFWPQPTALELRDGQKRVLSLKLNFPKGLGKFGERVGPPAPLLERIGAENRSAYTRAAAAAQQGDLRGALRGYSEALASRSLDALLPADASELRLVLTLGRYKCLAEVASPDDAAALLREVTSTLLPRVRLSEADPATAWDVMSTLAIAAARELNVGVVVESLPMALGVLMPQVASNPGVERMVWAAMSACLAPFARAQHWGPADEVAVAAIKALEPLGRHPLTAMPKAYQLEAYLASATSAPQQHVVGEIPPAGRAVLLRVAEAEGLERLKHAFTPVPVGPSRA